MEIHLFTTTRIEEKLQEVTNSLHLLNYVITGMAELHSLDHDTVIAINSIIFQGLDSINQVSKTRKSLALNYDPETMFYKSSFVPEEELTI